jgi:TPR repeat protein
MLAQMIQDGKGYQQKNFTKAVEYYDLLIERASEGWY